VAKIKLKIISLSQNADNVKENTMIVENISELIQHIESKYPQEYYAFNIFLKGKTVDDKSKNLHDGDEVIIVPIMSGS
jgi:molybdopterin converting factor small subunit